MLSSLDLNGDVPEAVVTVVTFDLEEEDYDILRAGAGRHARTMRFLEVRKEMLAGIEHSGWPKEYPPPIIGRLFLPETIEVSGARLITLDSDMIVNVSLRPLFELDLGSDYVAACHDTPRVDSPNYFNSGMMVIDIDRYKHFEIAQRCLAWLGGDGVSSRWPDQDALNLMVGDLWVRLDYRWNMHCLPPVNRPITAEDYDQAFIAHYAAVKPWKDLRHIGRSLYLRHLELFRQRLATYRSLQEQADTGFIFAAHELLLGHEPTEQAVRAMQGLQASEVIQTIVSSSQFWATTLLSLKLDVPFPSGTYAGVPGVRHRLWAAERMRVTRATALQLAAASSWRELLMLLLNDPLFIAKSGISLLSSFADAVRARLAGEELGFSEVSDEPQVMSVA